MRPASSDHTAEAGGRNAESGLGTPRFTYAPMCASNSSSAAHLPVLPASALNQQWLLIQPNGSSAASSMSGTGSRASMRSFMHFPQRRSADGTASVHPQLSASSTTLTDIRTGTSGSTVQGSGAVLVDWHRQQLEQQLLHLQLSDSTSPGLMPHGTSFTLDASGSQWSIANHPELNSFVTADTSTDHAIMHTVASDSSQTLCQVDFATGKTYTGIRAPAHDSPLGRAAHYTVAAGEVTAGTCASGQHVLLQPHYTTWEAVEPVPAAFQSSSATLAHLGNDLTMPGLSLPHITGSSGPYSQMPSSVGSIAFNSAPLPMHTVSLAQGSASGGAMRIGGAADTYAGLHTSHHSLSQQQVLANLLGQPAAASSSAASNMTLHRGPGATVTRGSSLLPAHVLPGSAGVSSPLPSLSPSSLQFVSRPWNGPAVEQIPSRLRVLPPAVQQRIMTLCQTSHVVSVRDFDEKVVSKLCLLVDAHDVDETIAMLNHLEHRMRSKQGPMRNGPGYLDVAVCSHMDMLKAQGMCPKDMKLDEYARQVLDPLTFQELCRTLDGNRWLSWDLLDEGVVQLLNRLPVPTAVEKLQEIGAHSFKNVDNIKGCIVSVLNTKIREDRRGALR